MFGHSLIVDPWGKVLAQAGDDICVIETELDAGLLEKVRGMIPMREHRRDLGDVPLRFVGHP